MGKTGKTGKAPPPIDVALRPYQGEAVESAGAAYSEGEHPVLSLPTGAGKSLVAAAIVERILAGDPERARVVVTVPSRELAEQNERALRLLLPPGDVGVACAALGRRETDRRVIVGTPQSLAGAIGFQPTCVLVDEAHQMPLHKGSWFARLFAGLPRGRHTPRIGLSATTFRTADGAIYGGPASWFTCQPFEISVSELVALGHLAPVRYVAPGALMTTHGVQRSAGDYSQGDLVRANIERVEDQVAIILDALRQRRKAMVFAVNVEHAEAYRACFEAAGEPAALIVGAMEKGQRRAEVAAFKAGEKRIAVTVAAALTGFDVPDIDVLASCRPTMSPIIHTQSIGRGTRPAPGKADCLVLDFAQNVRSFGPVHRPHFDGSGQPLAGAAPWQACRACGTYSHYEEPFCTHCGEAMPAQRIVTARDLEFGTISFWREADAIERLVASRGTLRLPVETLALHAYQKRSDPESVSCMISVGLGGQAIVRTWHKRFKAERWRTFWTGLLGDGPAPRSLPEAYGRRGELVRPAYVTIARDGAFWRIDGVEYEDDEAPFAGLARVPTELLGASAASAA